MINTQWLNEAAEKLSAVIPEGVKQARHDLQKTFRAILQSKLADLDLVTREEFDVQTKLLEKTQQKLSEISRQLDKIEQKIQNK